MGPSRPPSRRFVPAREVYEMPYEGEARAEKPRSIHDLTLSQVGLNSVIIAIISTMSLFPFVGLVIGWYYASQRHVPTKRFGRQLFMLAVLLHMVYFCVVCPLLAFFAVQQF